MSLHLFTIYRREGTLQGLPLIILLISFCCFFTNQSVSQTISVSPDTTICLGGTASLSAQVVGGGGYGTGSYSFMTIPFDTMPFSGGIPIDTSFHAARCSAGGHDDCWGGPFDIGFSFCFLNVIYTQFWVGSNGWISFTLPNNTWNNYVPDTLPNGSNNTPKNCIMAPWQDWYPGSVGGTNDIYFYTTGIAPDRKCVVYWKNCPMYNCTTIKGTFQIVIHEQNSAIENNIHIKDSCNWQGNKATQGVQNATGTVAFIHPGRNNKSWKAFDESTQFVPDGITWYTGGFPGGTAVGYGDTINISPTVTTTYTGVVQVCGGVYSADDVTVTVMDPRFTYPSAFYCVNSPNPVPALNMNAGVFTALPAGLVFVSNITGEVDLAASAPGVYTITHTITVPCTVSASRTMTIYALPAAPVAVTPTVSRCGPGNVTFSVTTGLHQGVRWYDAPSGGTLLPLTGLTVTTAIVATTLFYAETYDTTTTCYSGSRTLITAIVKPIPVITNTVRRDTVCSGFNNFFQLLADQPGTTFSWTASVTIGNVTGFTTPGSGNTISDNLTNNLFTSGEVTYVVSPSLNGCTGPPVSFRTTVKPRPNVIITPPADTICSGQTTNIVLTSGVPGSAFSWTAVPGSANVTGSSGGSGALIQQTLFNSGTAIDFVTYTVTATAKGCVSLNSTLVIHVNPVAHLTTSPLWQTICSKSVTNIILTSDVTGATYTWTAGLTFGNVTGFSNGNGSTIIQTLTNNLFTPGVVTYSITPSSNGCPGTLTNFVDTVNPAPDLSNVPLRKSICNGSNTNITLTSHVAGTLFTWICTASSPNVTGYLNNTSNPTSQITQLLFNSGFNVDTVIYHLVGHAKGCNGDTTKFKVIVFPVADVYFNPLSQTICSAQTTNISNLSHVAGASYTWTAAGSSGSVSGYSASSGNLIAQTLTNTGSNVESVTYTVTPSANGCPGTPNNVVITVNPPPVVTLTRCWDSPTTTNAAPISLKGGIPLGGTWSGTGVTAGVFNPALSGPGTFTISYSYTNMYSCTRTATKPMTVISAPAFLCGNNFTDPRDNTSYPTVKLGTLCWMASNLNYGTTIGSAGMQRDNCTAEKYCYSDNPVNCSSTGGLYMWDELMNYSPVQAVQGLCPPGWRVPVENDWNGLFLVYVSSGFAGSALKYDGFSGYNAFLSGVRFENVNWNFDSFAILYWSSTQHAPDKAWAHGMNSFNPSVSYYPSLKSNAFAVRCVR
ncbi:MAG: hypothetical protein NTU98_15265 [Bacteroidetes bacterium]|nr:hypothetical protein [Bacteroidota bacterium]